MVQVHTGAGTGTGAGTDTYRYRCMVHTYVLEHIVRGTCCLIEAYTKLCLCVSTIALELAESKHTSLNDRNVDDVFDHMVWVCVPSIPHGYKDQCNPICVCTYLC